MTGPGIEQILQEYPHRVVTLEQGGATVRKTYRGSDPAEVLVLAQREYDRLARFSHALASVDGATCPTPIELIDGPEPAVRMTRAHGVPLSTWLEREPDQARLAEIAAVLQEALVAYVSTFGEPYYDFHFRNVLVDETSGDLSFLDFGVPEHLVPVRHMLDDLSAVDASLGNLLGGSLFESIRPKQAHRVTRNRRTMALAAQVVAGMQSQATNDGVKQATTVVFLACVTWGPLTHRLWYRPFRPTLRWLHRSVDRIFAGSRPAPFPVS